MAKELKVFGFRGLVGEYSKRREELLLLADEVKELAKATEEKVERWEEVMRKEKVV